MVKRLISVVGVVMIASMLVLGCAPKVAPPAGEEAQEPAGPIKIGFMGNLSSASSISSKAAAMLAVDEINEAGGILGRPVELIVEDTKGEIPKCVEIYKKLVMVDHVLLMVIAEKVEMGVAGMEIGAELYPEFPHIMLCTIGSGDPVWHHVRDDYDKYKFGFQTYYFTSTGYLTILGTEILPMVYKDAVDTRKIALIYEDMEWTRPLRKGLEGVAPRLAEVYEEQGLEIVYETTLSLDQKVFTSVFEEVAASGAGILDCAMGYTDEIAFTKQWAESSAKNIPWFIWGGLAGMPAAWDATEGKVIGGLVGSSMVRAAITDKTIPFMDNLVSKYEVGPIFGSHTTYDSFYGFRKALIATGSTEDVEALIHEMERVEEVAVLGTIGWEPRYHYNLPYPKYIMPIIQWQKEGEMTIIFPTDIATGEYISPQDLRK